MIRFAHLFFGLFSIGLLISPAALAGDERRESRLPGDLAVGQMVIVRLPWQALQGGGQPAPHRLSTVETSCSCLQVLEFPRYPTVGDELILRYLALRPGPVDIDLLAVPADAGLAPLLWKVTGQVRPGDDAAARRLMELPPDLLLRSEERLSPSLRVDAAEALSLWRNGQITLVDVRTSADQASAEVPGLRLSIFEVSAGKLPPTSAVLLTSSPWAEPAVIRALEKIAATHPQAKVRWLEGGITAWLTAGGPVTRNSPGAPPPAEQAPERWLQAGARKGWTLIDASGRPATETEWALPLASRPDGSPEQVWQTVKNSGAPVAVLAPDAETARAWAAQASRPGLVVLSGGWPGLREVLTTQASLWTRRRQPGAGTVTVATVRSDAVLPGGAAVPSCGSCGKR